MKFMTRRVKNCEFPAEFFWDERLLLYKCGNTVNVVELSEMGFEEKRLRFRSLFGHLVRKHKGDELVQKFFFREKYPELFESL